MDLADTTTDNYATIAKLDDAKSEAKAENEIPARTDRATGREQRIAAAVERSKTEYKREHAFTERGWLHVTPNDTRNEAGRPKVDRQRLEYLVTSLYSSGTPQYAAALSQILDAADFTKSLAGLTRELVDVGMRCALHEGRLDEAMRFAECTRSLWKTSSAGQVCLVADVYLKAQRPYEAIPPLLVSTSFTGLHWPVLTRLSTALRQVPSDSTVPLVQLVDHMASRQQESFERPLFEDPPNHRRTGNSALQMDTIEVGQLDVVLKLDAQGKDALRGTIRRLAGKGDAADDVKERGVREL